MILSAIRKYFVGTMLSGLNEVNDHLFISGVRVVSKASLQIKGITCVINCSCIEPDYDRSPFKYHSIWIEDNERANLSSYFEMATTIINEERLAGGKTLVYCVAGISRSATLCIAYLMKYQNMTLRSAFKHLRSRRRIIHPNKGFFQQLIDFERSLFNETTVAMVRINSEDPSQEVLVPDVYYELCRGMVWLKSIQNKRDGSS